ncbi:MAG: hypothetical protein HFJ84_01130 [Clostridiales bacterium]|jgi:hypothetical protein|nr:hypothetical protein [Clostridiales bacterium]
MKANLKKTRVLAMIFSALVMASACSMTAFAKDNEIHELTTHPSYLAEEEIALEQSTEEGLHVDLTNVTPIRDDEAIVHTLTEKPSYLISDSGISFYGDKQPGDVWEVPYRGAYSFNGECALRGNLYTNYLVTGQYSYTVTVTCDSKSASAVTCYGFNASSSKPNDPINSMTISPGQTKTMKLTGLSTISKVYLRFTPVTSSYSRTYVRGQIS